MMYAMYQQNPDGTSRPMWPPGDVRNLQEWRPDQTQPPEYHHPANAQQYDNSHQHNNQRSHNNYGPYVTTGPTIVTDEEEERKRRLRVIREYEDIMGSQQTLPPMPQAAMQFPTPPYGMAPVTMQQYPPYHTGQPSTPQWTHGYEPAQYIHPGNHYPAPYPTPYPTPPNGMVYSRNGNRVLKTNSPSPKTPEEEDHTKTRANDMDQSSNQATTHRQPSKTKREMDLEEAVEAQQRQLEKLQKKLKTRDEDRAEKFLNRQPTPPPKLEPADSNNESPLPSSTHGSSTEPGEPNRNAGEEQDSDKSEKGSESDEEEEDTEELTQKGQQDIKDPAHPTDPLDSLLDDTLPKDLKHARAKPSKDSLEPFNYTAAAVLQPHMYSIPPPDDHNCIFPMEIVPPANVRKPKMYLMCRPTSQQPILLLGQTGDWGYVENEPGRGALSLHSNRETAVLTLLQYYIHNVPPADMCLNCYKFHPQHECPDTPRNFQSLINISARLPPNDPSHFKMGYCRSCGTTHAPTRGKCLARLNPSR